ncbi:MAG: RNA polymerase sigma factor [Elusimicrobiota bacterium]|nr:MAG: RNA polymerase sigma factor [Elusimicrobiota bacterium]
MKRARDEAAAQLARERGRFLAFLEARLGSREEAEELLQAAYVKGLKSSETIKDREKVTAWFFQLLRNALTDHWRKKAAEGRAVNAFGAETARQEKLDSAKLDREVCKCVSALVGTIKPEYADAIRKVDLEDASVKDLAKTAGVSANSAAVRLHRARKTLKKRLIQTCGKCAEHGCRDCDCGKV